MKRYPCTILALALIFSCGPSAQALEHRDVVCTATKFGTHITIRWPAFVGQEYGEAKQGGWGTYEAPEFRWECLFKNALSSINGAADVEISLASKAWWSGKLASADAGWDVPLFNLQAHYWNSKGVDEYPMKTGRINNFGRLMRMTEYDKGEAFFVTDLTPRFVDVILKFHVPDADGLTFGVCDVFPGAGVAFEQVDIQVTYLDPQSGDTCAGI